MQPNLSDLQEHLGVHRVKSPKGVLPQEAEILDPSLPLCGSELLIEPSYLNVDSASFRQFWQAAKEDTEQVKKDIHAVIEERGKLHNRVTGSGGMLIGTIKEKGNAVTNPELSTLCVGDTVATLVSLTLTPLKINKILEVFPTMERLSVEGQAILFNSGMAVALPREMGMQEIALAALDVCGAPAQTAKLVSPGDTVAIIGAGGKSGVLCGFQAKESVGEHGKVVGLDYSSDACTAIREFSFFDEVVECDARDALSSSEHIRNCLGKEGANVVINVSNVPGTEMASILSARSGGLVYFFSMSTSFTKAALGAEGVGADVRLMIGNGYTPGHAKHTLEILQTSKEVFSYFQSHYET